MEKRTSRNRALAWILVVLMVISPSMALAEGSLDVVVQEELLLFAEEDDGEALLLFAGEEIAPMSPHWSLPITQEVVDALNDRDSAPFGVIPIGAADGSVPNFELVTLGGVPGIRVYNRMNSYHGIDVLLDHDDDDIDPADRFNPTPGTLYTLTVTGQVSGGGVFRTLFPLDGTAYVWETGGRNGSATTHTLEFTSVPPATNFGDDGFVGRITTNCPWVAGGALVEEFVITSLTITSWTPPPVNVFYNLRADGQIQDYFVAGDAVTGFTAPLLAISGNPVITVAHNPDVDNTANFPDVAGLYYLHIAGGRAEDYYAIRVGGVGEGIEGTLLARQVITVRGRIDGAPPAGGVTMAIDYAAAPFLQGASAHVTEANGHFVLSHVISPANVSGGLNIRTRAGGEGVGFYIYDLAITGRPLFGDEVDIYLGEIPGVAPPPPTGLTTAQAAALLEAAFADVAVALPTEFIVHPGEEAAAVATVTAVIDAEMAAFAFTDVLYSVDIAINGDAITGEVIFIIDPGAMSDGEIPPDALLLDVNIPLFVVQGGIVEVLWAGLVVENIINSLVLEGIPTVSAIEAAIAGATTLEHVEVVVSELTVHPPAFPAAGAVTGTFEITYANTDGWYAPGDVPFNTVSVAIEINPAFDLEGAIAWSADNFDFTFEATNDTTPADILALVQGILGDAGADIVLTITDFVIIAATATSTGFVEGQMSLSFGGIEDYIEFQLLIPRLGLGPGPSPSPAPGRPRPTPEPGSALTAGEMMAFRQWNLSGGFEQMGFAQMHARDIFMQDPFFEAFADAAGRRMYLDDGTFHGRAATAIADGDPDALTLGFLMALRQWNGSGGFNPTTRAQIAARERFRESQFFQDAEYAFGRMLYLEDGTPHRPAALAMAISDPEPETMWELQIWPVVSMNNDGDVVVEIFMRDHSWTVSQITGVNFSLAFDNRVTPFRDAYWGIAGSVLGAPEYFGEGWIDFIQDDWQSMLSDSQLYQLRTWEGIPLATAVFDGGWDQNILYNAADFFEILPGDEGLRVGIQYGRYVVPTVYPAEAIIPEPDPYPYFISPPMYLGNGVVSYEIGGLRRGDTMIIGVLDDASGESITAERVVPQGGVLTGTFEAFPFPATAADGDFRFFVRDDWYEIYASAPILIDDGLGPSPDDAVIIPVVSMNHDGNVEVEIYLRTGRNITAIRYASFSLGFDNAVTPFIGADWGVVDSLVGNPVYFGDGWIDFWLDNWPVTLSQNQWNVLRSNQGMLLATAVFSGSNFHLDETTASQFEIVPGGTGLRVAIQGGDYVTPIIGDTVIRYPLPDYHPYFISPPRYLGNGEVFYEIGGLLPHSTVMIGVQHAVTGFGGSIMRDVPGSGVLSDIFSFMPFSPGVADGDFVLSVDTGNFHISAPIMIYAPWPIDPTAISVAVSTVPGGAAGRHRVVLEIHNATGAHIFDAYVVVIGGVHGAAGPPTMVDFNFSVGHGTSETIQTNLSLPPGAHVEARVFLTGLPQNGLQLSAYAARGEGVV